MPAFVLPDADGKPVSSAELMGEAGLVLFFYPRDHTFGCTREVCAFRDAYHDIKDLGAEVAGISRDTSESHAAFRSRQHLPYPLLSDTSGAVHAAYGIGRRWLVQKDRVTFVINAQGIITHIFESALSFARHATEALQAVRKGGIIK